MNNVFSHFPKMRFILVLKCLNIKCMWTWSCKSRWYVPVSVLLTCGETIYWCIFKHTNCTCCIWVVVLCLRFLCDSIFAVLCFSICVFLRVFCFICDCCFCFRVWDLVLRFLDLRLFVLVVVILSFVPFPHHPPSSSYLPYFHKTATTYHWGPYKGDGIGNTNDRGSGAPHPSGDRGLEMARVAGRGWKGRGEWGGVCVWGGGGGRRSGAMGREGWWRGGEGVFWDLFLGGIFGLFIKLIN